MQNEKKKAVKCPICGRFTSENTVEAYRAKAEAKVNTPATALASMEGKHIALQGKYGDLLVENNANLERIHFLISRNWWERLINKV